MTTTVPNMSHKFSLTRWDLFRGHMHASMRNPVLTGLFVVMSTLMACTSLREPDMAARPTAYKVGFVIVFVVMIFSFISVGTLVVLWLTILLRKHRGVLGEHILEITPNGLIERTDLNETLHRWQGIHKIVRTRNYVYLWVTDSMMHIVPVRSFPSEEAARHFQSEIETRKAGAGGTPV